MSSFRDWLLNDLQKNSRQYLTQKELTKMASKPGFVNDPSFYGQDRYGYDSYRRTVEIPLEFIDRLIQSRVVGVEFLEDFHLAFTEDTEWDDFHGEMLDKLKTKTHQLANQEREFDQFINEVRRMVESRR